MFSHVSIHSDQDARRRKARRRVNNASLHKTSGDGRSFGWMGLGGLWGLAYSVPASDSSPQERHRHKRKLTVMVTKAEMTVGSHKTGQLEFSSKQKHASWHGVTYTTAAVKTAEWSLFGSERPYQVCFTPLGTSDFLRVFWAPAWNSHLTQLSN